jgi:hypothetical protein
VLDNAYRRRHAARVEGNEKSRHQARKIRGAGGKKALERRGGNKRGGKRRAGRRRGYQSLLRDQLYTDPGLRVVDGIMTGRGRRVKRCGELCL